MINTTASITMAKMRLNVSPLISTAIWAPIIAPTKAEIPKYTLNGKGGYSLAFKSCRGQRRLNDNGYSVGAIGHTGREPQKN